MKYAVLGNTGLIVSRLAFDAMTFTSGNKDIASVYTVGTECSSLLSASGCAEPGNCIFPYFDGVNGCRLAHPVPTSDE